MGSIFISKETLNLDVIANSGQCFRMKLLNGHNEQSRYAVRSLNRVVVLSQQGSVLSYDCSDATFDTFWRRYLDLGVEYGTSAVDEDDCFMYEAIKYGKGMRILRQDLWETIVSFIISQNNNIPRIKACIDRLCNFYDGFPSADSILEHPDYLGSLGIGYRDRYVLDAAEKWGALSKILAVEGVGYEDYIQLLKQIDGVGDKVANCVALFGLHHLGACPIDVWMNRIIIEEYGGCKPAWMDSDNAGYLQQLAFYYKREVG